MIQAPNIQTSSIILSMWRKPYAVLNYRRFLNFLCIKRTRTLGLMVSIFILHKGLCSYQIYALIHTQSAEKTLPQKKLYSPQKNFFYRSCLAWLLRIMFQFCCVACSAIHSFFYKHKTFSISILRMKFGLDIFNISETKRFCLSRE